MWRDLTFCNKLAMLHQNLFLARCILGISDNTTGFCSWNFENHLQIIPGILFLELQIRIETFCPKNKFHIFIDLHNNYLSQKAYNCIVLDRIIFSYNKIATIWKSFKTDLMKEKNFYSLLKAKDLMYCQFNKFKSNKLLNRDPNKYCHVWNQIFYLF